MREKSSVQWAAGIVLVLVLASSSMAQTPSPAAGPAPDASVRALSEAVQRLAAALERQAAQAAEERDARRADAAAGILALRYRKIERLDDEVQSIAREEEEFERQVALMKEQVEELQRHGRTDSGQLSPELKAAIDQVELRIRLEGERIARQRERALLLQNESAAEQRRLTSLEAILDQWLQKEAGATD